MNAVGGKQLARVYGFLLTLNLRVDRTSMGMETH